jgi:uncharacterized protein
LNEDPHQRLSRNVASDDEAIQGDNTFGSWPGMLGFFCGSLLLLSLLLNYGRWLNEYQQVYAGAIVFSALTLICLWRVRKEIAPLFSFTNVRVSKLLLFGLIAICASLLINYALGWLNKIIFHHGVYHLVHLFRQLPYPWLAMSFFIVVQPAIIEEIAFRGIIQQGLMSITDRRQAITTMAFIFAIVHMSFISFFWLVPFAIWLGYIRDRERTIWYGVFIHICFNATACAFDYFGM